MYILLNKGGLDRVERERETLEYDKWTLFLYVA